MRWVSEEDIGIVSRRFNRSDRLPNQSRSVGHSVGGRSGPFRPLKSTMFGPETDRMYDLDDPTSRQSSPLAVVPSKVAFKRWAMRSGVDQAR